MKSEPQGLNAIRKRQFSRSRGTVVVQECTRMQGSARNRTCGRRKAIQAMEQEHEGRTRPNPIKLREVLDCVEQLNDANRRGTLDSGRDVTFTSIANKRGGNQDMSKIMCTLNTDMWACGRSCPPKEGKATEQLESCTHRENLWPYASTHSQFTRETDQGRSMRLAAVMPPPSAFINMSSRQVLSAGRRSAEHSRRMTERWTSQTLENDCAHDDAAWWNVEVSRASGERVQDLRKTQGCCHEVSNQSQD